MSHPSKGAPFCTQLSRKIPYSVSWEKKMTLFWHVFPLTRAVLGMNKLPSTFVYPLTSRELRAQGILEYPSVSESLFLLKDGVLYKRFICLPLKRKRCCHRDENTHTGKSHPLPCNRSLQIAGLNVTGLALSQENFGKKFIEPDTRPCEALLARVVLPNSASFTKKEELSQKNLSIEWLQSITKLLPGNLPTYVPLAEGASVLRRNKE